MRHKEKPSFCFCLRLTVTLMMTLQFRMVQQLFEANVMSVNNCEVNGNTNRQRPRSSEYKNVRMCRTQENVLSLITTHSVLWTGVVFLKLHGE
ncbi:hypothetical protein R3I94_020692 [Phoxinus phoxinus]